MESEILEKKNSSELSEEIISLVDKLRYVETYNKKLDSLVEEYNNTFIKQFNLQDEFQITQEDIPYIDISRIQRDIIDRKLKERNDVLKHAVQKRKSIEDSLYDLSRDNKGFLRFLPKYPDKEHNEKVDELIDLIGYRNIMESALYKNLFCLLTKPVISPFIFGTFGYMIGLCVVNIINFPKPVQNNIILAHSIFGFFQGALITTKVTSKNENLPWKDAKYLDDKIKELF